MVAVKFVLPHMPCYGPLNGFFSERLPEKDWQPFACPCKKRRTSEQFDRSDGKKEVLEMAGHLCYAEINKVQTPTE